MAWVGIIGFDITMVLGVGSVETIERITNVLLSLQLEYTSYRTHSILYIHETLISP